LRLIQVDFVIDSERPASRRWAATLSPRRNRHRAKQQSDFHLNFSTLHNHTAQHELNLLAAPMVSAE